MRQKSGRPRGTRRGGYSLLEVMVVSTIMGIIVAIPIPMFAKAIEQSKLDVASANLRAIWCAERYYYLENKSYGSLADLQAAGLVDPSIGSGSSYYAYSIDKADGQSFTATAQHPANSRCSGSMSVDQSGRFTCQVVYS